MNPTLTTTDVADLLERYEHFSELAAERPVLISVAEHERLKRRDQQAFLAADTPDRFLGEIEELAWSEPGHRHSLSTVG